jgi:hypothetical protein
MNILGSLCSGVFSQSIKSFTSSAFNLNTRSDLISYYRFYVTDVRGVNVANYYTGSPIYDSSLVLTETVINTDTKFPNGSLYSPAPSQSYFLTGPFTQTSTTGLTLTGWFNLSSSSTDSGNFAMLLKYVSGPNVSSNIITNSSIQIQVNPTGILSLLFSIASGSAYYLMILNSPGGYVDNKWYFFSIVFTQTQVTFSIQPYSSGNATWSSTVTLSTTANILIYDSAGNYQQNSNTTFSALGVSNMLPAASTRYGVYRHSLTEGYWVNGGIGDMRVYNSALSSTDTTALFDYVKNTTSVSGIAILYITTNSITVSFSSVTPADYFTVTATPAAGGSAITQSDTLSPITVLGLQTGTKYNITVSSTAYSTTSTSSTVLTATTLTPYIVDASLSLFYPFDISSNNYTPNYATGFEVYDASFNNGATISTSQFITGSGSAYLPSSTAQVRLGNFTSSGTNMSVSFWFYVSSYVTNQSFFACVPSTTNMSAGGIEMRVHSTTQLRVSIANASSIHALFTAPAANVWHHMVWVMKGTTWTVYIDNVSQSLSYPNGSAIAPSALTYIYNSIGNSPYPYNLSSITGYISDFKIYDLGLSTTQISSLYSGRNNVAMYNFTSSTLNNMLMNSATMNYDASLNGLSNITSTQTVVNTLSLYTNTGYVTSNPSFQLSNINGFSFCTWVYFTTMNSPNCLISLGTSYYSYSPGDGIGLYIDASGVYSQYWFGSSNSNFATTKYGVSSQFLNRWNHVACTVSTAASTNTTTTWSIYINGLLMGTTTETNNVYNYYNGQTINKLNIGTNINRTTTHSAYYNDIKVYNRVLSLSEIQTMAIGLLTNLQVSSSNLLGWFDAYQLYSGATNGITAWKDKSLNNSTATLSSDCNYVTSLNSNYPVPAVYFSSRSSYMITNVSDSVRTTTLCAVVTFTQNNTVLWFTPSDSTDEYIISLGIGNAGHGAGIWNTPVGVGFIPIQNVVINVPTVVIVTINYNTNTVSISQNGYILMTINYIPLSSTSLAGTGTFRYGSTSTGFSTTNAPWTNYVSEFMFFNVGFTDVQKQLYEGYLAWKWGIQSLLPSTHPYYSAAPALSAYIAPTSTAHVIPYTPTNITWTSVTGVTKYTATITDSIVNLYSGIYTITASSAYNGGDQGANSMFHVYSGTSWVISGQTAYSGGSSPYYTTTGYSTTVDVSGTVYGEWFQIDCPSAFVLYSYTMGSNTNTRMPTSWVIAGANSTTGPWTSIQNLLNNAPGYNCNNVYTIPSAYTSVISSGGTYFTIGVNAKNTSYSSYRIIFTSAYSNNNWLGVNNFYMTSYINNTYFTAGSLGSSSSNSDLNNPINYLKLDTASTDTGSSPQTVTTAGSVTYTTIAGKQCAYFSNSMSNYLYFNFLNPTQLTFCFWVYIIDNGSYTEVSISSVGGWDPSLQCDMNGTGVYGFFAVPTQWAVSIGYANSNTGNWVHLAYTVNQSTYVCQLYVNGTLRASGTGSGALGKNKSHFILGRSGDNARAFYGYLRQFCVYNSILTAAQIQSIYNLTA